MRPVAVAHQQVGDPQPSLFDATSMLANLRLLGFFRFPIQTAVMSCDKVAGGVVR